MKSFEINYREGAYKVSIPDYEGGRVYKAGDVEFQPIETAPGHRTMFVAIAVLPDYTTDPWCVWKEEDNMTKENHFGFVRWPHPFPPTHWMAIAKMPTYQELQAKATGA